MHRATRARCPPSPYQRPRASRSSFRRSRAVLAQHTTTVRQSSGPPANNEGTGLLSSQRSRALRLVSRALARHRARPVRRRSHRRGELKPGLHRARRTPTLRAVLTTAPTTATSFPNCSLRRLDGLRDKGASAYIANSLNQYLSAMKGQTCYRTIYVLEGPGNNNPP